MKIISHSHIVEGTEYRMKFTYKGSEKHGSFYAFLCDKDGNVFPRTNEDAEANYQRCLNGFDERNNMQINPGKLDAIDFCNRIPSIGLCVCGAKIYLANFTNTCDCGRDYNSAGQELAPREQWGEETSEHWTDCI